jgi:membrane protein implicated in regulation of membrane protease activity
MRRKANMYLLFGAPLLVLIVGLVLLVALFHVVFSLPFWLVVGGVAAVLWYRGGPRRRWLRPARRHAYLERRVRW